MNSEMNRERMQELRDYAKEADADFFNKAQILRRELLAIKGRMISEEQKNERIQQALLAFFRANKQAFEDARLCRYFSRQVAEVCELGYDEPYYRNLDGWLTADLKPNVHAFEDGFLKKSPVIPDVLRSMLQSANRTPPRREMYPLDSSAILCATIGIVPLLFGVFFLCVSPPLFPLGMILVAISACFMLAALVLAIGNDLLD